MAEKVFSPRLSHFQNAAASLGGCGLLVLLAFGFTSHWQWSLLMDDVAYLSYMPSVTNVYPAFRTEVANYWSMGRFYPVKYMANLLKFHYLPLSPAIFHGCNLVQFAFIILITALACARLGSHPDSRKRLVWFLCVASLAVAQRPLLDVIALNTIAEGWVILFLGLGLLFYRRSVWLSRLSFLLCALSKEPAIVVFAASAVAELYSTWIDNRQRRTALAHAILDGALFVGMVLVIQRAKSSGDYLQGYHIFTLANLKPFVIGLAKCAIGLVPLGILFSLSRFQRVSAEELLTILFGLAYLLLAVPRGIAGYLLIPVSYAFLAAGLIRLHSFPERLAPRGETVAAILLVFIMASSLWRYTRYANAINESSLALRLLTVSSSPRVVIVNGVEAADAVTKIGLSSGTPVRGVFEASTDAMRQLVSKEKSEVVLFELTGYFGPFSPGFIEAARPASGWRTEIHERFYNIFLR